MKQLLKETIKPFYYYIKNKNLREFYRFYGRCGGSERYNPTDNVKFLNYKFDVSDLESFLWQFKNSLSNVNNLFVEYHICNNAEQKLSKILDVFEQNGFRYYIESLTSRRHPFVNKSEEGNMNIFGVKR